MKNLPSVQQVQGFFAQHDLDGIDPELFLQSLKAANNKPARRSPQVGDIVLFQGNPDDSIAHSNFNHDRIPAIITRKWSEVCVNLKIIPDCGPMQDRTSVVHISANPAGYNFIFPDENENAFFTDHFKNTGKKNDDTKDASSFLKQKD